MRKQFDYMHLINHKSDTLSLGGSGQIVDTSEQYGKAGAKNGAEFGGFIGGLFGLGIGVSTYVETFPTYPIFILYTFSSGAAIGAGPVGLPIATTTVGATVGGAVGTVVGGTVGAAVGTVDALRHSGSSHGRLQNSSNSGPAGRP